MAHQCQKCGKGVQYGHLVSHAKNRTRHIFKPNLKRSTVLVDGKKVRMVLCTACVKLMKKLGYK